MLLDPVARFPDFRSRNSKVKLLLLLILLIAACLRFTLVDFFGLSSDEFATLMIVSRPSFKSVLQTSLVVPQPLPPLYFLLNKAMVGAFGQKELGLRFLSAICSLGTVYLIFLLGRTLFNSQVAIIGAALCALNTTQILYAQTARPYALALLLSTGSILSFLNWLKKETLLNRFNYVASTSLLLYTHYLFLPLLMIQTLYFFWCQRFPQPIGYPKRSWRNWLLLQFTVGLTVLPLFWQVSTMVRDRSSLDWVRYKPPTQDIVPFFNPKYLFFSGLISALLCFAKPFRKRFVRLSVDVIDQEGRKRFISGLMLLLIWYGLPPLLFCILYWFTGINLFVERYLLLMSLPPYLLIPGAALLVRGHRWGQTFVIVYVLYYGVSAPILSYVKKGHFSQASPGENQWREILGALNDSTFQSSPLLFQSPYIEADQLNFSPNTPLFDYLSAPLRSFYLHESPRAVQLLPHYWHAAASQEAFRAGIKALILRDREFTLLCDEEFWLEFRPWLARELDGRFELRAVEEFRSSNALLKKIRVLQRSSVT